MPMAHRRKLPAPGSPTIATSRLSHDPVIRRPVLRGSRYLFLEKRMQLAMIGLGKMGGNMTARLLRDKHSVVVYDHHAEHVAKYVAEGGKAAKDLADVVRQLSAPRIVWIMVPAG